VRREPNANVIPLRGKRFPAMGSNPVTPLPQLVFRLGLRSEMPVAPSLSGVFTVGTNCRTVSSYCMTFRVNGPVRPWPISFDGRKARSQPPCGLAIYGVAAHAAVTGMR
jgi:hypothetical protein